MNFNELDERLRAYETAQDYCVLPGLFMVARLDGRGFTRLTKEVCAFESPYDERFRDLMVTTVTHLMNCGFRVVYGYTQSDEISLLFRQDEALFNRKLRKWDSILAGEASGAFSVALGRPACFDCRISQLPSADLVVEYFRWRQEDAIRNALNAYCYWTLRKEGFTASQATESLLTLSVSNKNELLFQRGININEAPLWQRRGTGVFWTEVEKEGRNPLTGETTIALRRCLKVDFDLPMKDGYEEYLRVRLESGSDKTAISSNKSELVLAINANRL